MKRGPISRSQRARQSDGRKRARAEARRRELRDAAEAVARLRYGYPRAATFLMGADFDVTWDKNSDGSWVKL